MQYGHLRALAVSAAAAATGTYFFSSSWSASHDAGLSGMRGRSARMIT